MTKENLKLKTKKEVLDFIRNRLKFNEVKSLRYVEQEDFNKEHQRFEMSGYEDKTGECTVNNLNILNKFADLGIYDYTTYLFLDFYKGCGTLYLQHWGDSQNIIELAGYGTTEIIYKIFKQTIFTEKHTRRRN